VKVKGSQGLVVFIWLGVTLLYELVHWDGIDRPGEEGEEFERLVYGSVIH